MDCEHLPSNLAGFAAWFGRGALSIGSSHFQQFQKIALRSASITVPDNLPFNSVRCLVSSSELDGDARMCACQGDRLTVSRQPVNAPRVFHETLEDSQFLSTRPRLLFPGQISRLPGHSVPIVPSLEHIAESPNQKLLLSVATSHYSLASCLCPPRSLLETFDLGELGCWLLQRHRVCTNFDKEGVSAHAFNVGIITLFCPPFTGLFSFDGSSLSSITSSSISSPTTGQTFNELLLDRWLHVSIGIAKPWHSCLGKDSPDHRTHFSSGDSSTHECSTYTPCSRGNHVYRPFS